MSITPDYLTEEHFLSYGSSTIMRNDLTLLNLDATEVDVYCFIEENINELSSYLIMMNSAEVYWTISINKENWFIYRNNSWIETKYKNNCFPEFFTTEELTSIPERALTELISKFDTTNTKTIYLKNFIISNKETVQSGIKYINIESIQSYVKGTSFVKSSNNFIDTSLFLSINSCKISYSEPVNTKIRLLFRTTDSESWKAYKNNKWEPVIDTKIITFGNTCEEVNLISTSGWIQLLNKKLYVMIGLYSETIGETPTVNSILFDYNELESKTESNILEILTPEKNYEVYKLSQETFIYEIFPEEGIGFDDADDLYNFYTTPNKIKLRVLEMGTIIGTQTSKVYKAVVINTWLNKNFNLKLEMKTENGLAENIDNAYCLFNDSPVDSFRTKGELSINDSFAFSPKYPLYIDLLAGKSKVFYFRLTPTSTTTGSIQANIVATASEII